MTVIIHLSVLPQNGKQWRPRSESSPIWVCIVCISHFLRKAFLGNFRTVTVMYISFVMIMTIYLSIIHHIMANSGDPDQTALEGAVRSGCALFAVTVKIP